MLDLPVYLKVFFGIFNTLSILACLFSILLFSLKDRAYGYHLALFSALILYHITAFIQWGVLISRDLSEYQTLWLNAATTYIECMSLSIALIFFTKVMIDLWKSLKSGYKSLSSFWVNWRHVIVLIEVGVTALVFTVLFAIGKEESIPRLIGVKCLIWIYTLLVSQVFLCMSLSLFCWE